MAEQNPARYWRDIVRSAFLRLDEVSSQDADRQFHQYVEAEYEIARQRQTRGAGPNLELFVLGIASLTYGHLEVIEELLHNIPPRPNPARMLSGAIAALIPLPPELGSLADPAAALAWIRARQPHLHWSEDAGRFVLTSDQSGNRA